MKLLLSSLVAAFALVALPSASAKNFEPGDVRICNGARCIAIVERSVLPAIRSFYGSGPCPARVRRPNVGTPYFELRFRNGYATGIVATERLDRFLSYGVVLERFAGDAWYAVPRKLSRELRRLTVDLRPLRLSRAALAKSVGPARPRGGPGSP